MSIKFKSNRRSFKKKIRSAAPFIAMGVAGVIILSVLIFPKRIADATSRNSICSELGFGGGGHLFYEKCDKNFDKIIFVVGDTANTPKPSLGFPDLIKYAYTGNSEIYAMSVSKPSKSPRKIDTKDKDVTTTVAEHIEKMSATSDGADYLEAIRTAAKFAGKDKDRTLIYVIGSGLSDRGLLNFAGNKLLVIKEDTDSIVDKVQAELSEDTDELDSLTIFWDGIGEATSPQEDLSSDSKTKLIDIYTSLFIALSVDEESIVMKDRDTFDISSAKTSYSVRTSPSIEKIVMIDTYRDTETDIFKFNGGKDTLVNEAATVAKIKEYTNDKSIKSITLSAKVSRGESCRKDPDYELINSRYDRIRKLFVANGFDQSHIKMESGTFGPEEDCKNGKFQGEQIAAKNRYIEIKVER